MAQIKVADEVLKHDDAEIIDFLYDMMKGVKLTFDGAMDRNDPAVTYAAYGDIMIVTETLRKLNRRNQEKAL